MDCDNKEEEGFGSRGILETAVDNEAFFAQGY